MIRHLILFLFFVALINGYEYEEKFYNLMNVDHFSSGSIRTFSLRYLLNTKYWAGSSCKPGPIFIYTGNEGDIELFAENTGLVWDLAPDFNAMVVFAEHRYYGKSLPFGNESYSNLANLQHLSSTQALADFAVLVTYLKETIPGASKSPVVAFGGSYGGMLAAWARIKYPHIFDGALASSAPVLQFTGFAACSTFNMINTRTFADAGPNCASNIKKAWTSIRSIGSSGPSGYSRLNELMGLCPDSLIRSPADIDNLVAQLTGVLGYMAMVDYPYPNSFLQPVPGWLVTESCKELANEFETDAELLTSLRSAVSVYLNYTGAVQCFDFAQQTTPSLGALGWDFQACTTMVMPFCADKDSMFEPYDWNVTVFAKACSKRWFGADTRVNWAMTNYGGDHLSAASNIIFSNGYLDPWSGGGVLKLKPPNPSIHTILLKKGAHHYDLRGSNPKDTTEVRMIRAKEARIIGRWINQAHLDNRECVTDDKQHLHVAEDRTVQPEASVTLL